MGRVGAPPQTSCLCLSPASCWRDAELGENPPGRAVITVIPLTPSTFFLQNLLRIKHYEQSKSFPDIRYIFIT